MQPNGYLITSKEKIQKSFIHNLNLKVMLVSLVSSILALAGPFIFIIIIVWLQSNEKRKRYELQADLYAKALEKGQSIPVDWFTEPKKKRNPLNTGIICIATGIGIALFVWLFVFTGFEDLKDDAVIMFRLIGALGIIPFLIGIAFVIIHFIEKKKVTEENAK